MVKMDTNTKYRKKWSEDETILAFYYYCQIPFGKIDHRNPQIIQIAELIGRTPSSVSLKMGNLGHFDPSLQRRNVVGMSNASKLDEQVVKEFLDNWEELAVRARQIEAEYLLVARQRSTDIDTLPASDIETLPEGIDNLTKTKHRINQKFFREAVLSSYLQRCCITGMALPPLLVASHIKPWAVSNPKTERTNPCNGLCLNALHDKAFDRGLITVLPDYTVRVSSELKKARLDAETEWLLACDRQRITLPERFLPAREFLEYHNDMVFEKTIL